MPDTAVNKLSRTETYLMETALEAVFYPTPKYSLPFLSDSSELFGIYPDIICKEKLRLFHEITLKITV